MQVPTSQLPFPANRNAELAVPPLFRPEKLADMLDCRVAPLVNRYTVPTMLITYLLSQLYHRKISYSTRYINRHNYVYNNSSKSSNSAVTMYISSEKKITCKNVAVFFGTFYTGQEIRCEWGEGVQCVLIIGT